MKQIFESFIGCNGDNIDDRSRTSLSDSSRIFFQRKLRLLSVFVDQSLENIDISITILSDQIMKSNLIFH